MKYRITEHRWCWCGAPAAYVIVTGDARMKVAVEDVCGVGHGQMRIEQLMAKAEAKAEAETIKVGGTDD